jgi:hypothetical protein
MSEIAASAALGIFLGVVLGLSSDTIISTALMTVIGAAIVWVGLKPNLNNPNLRISVVFVSALVALVSTRLCIIWEVWQPTAQQRVEWLSGGSNATPFTHLEAKRIFLATKNIEIDKVITKPIEQPPNVYPSEAVCFGLKYDAFLSTQEKVRFLTTVSPELAPAESAIRALGDAERNALFAALATKFCHK